MNLQLTTYNLKLALIFMLICGLLTLGSGLLYGQDDYLNVKGNTRANTITFAGNLTDYPAAPLEGEIFYNSQAKLPRYFDGTTWKNFGGGPKTVATRIVAASDSLDTVCAGGVCSNPRADYTCNGTGDQEEINQAINDLPATGGAVYLLEGTYNISATPLPDPPETLKGIVLHSNTAIIGTGRGTVLKVASGASGVNVINASSVTGILISQLMIDGNNRTGSNNRGINFTTVTYSKIDKVWIEYMRARGINFSSSSNNNIIYNSYVWRSGQDGVYIDGSSNNTVSNNKIENNNFKGIYLISSASNNIISNNNIQGSNAEGIQIEQSSNNIISGNTLQSNMEQSIELGTSSNNNIISGNNVQGGPGIFTNGILVFGSSNNTISGNIVLAFMLDGIVITSSSANAITGNVIYDNGGSGDVDGIKLDNSDTNIISSNRLSDSAGTGYGINISTNTCDNNYLIGNLIDGAGYNTRIQDLGTATKYTDKAKMTWERKQISSGFSPLNVVTSPQTYVALNPTVNTTLTFSPTAIPVAGSLLILENVSATYSVTINDTPDDNVNLSETHSPILGPYDTLKLIWNGTRWLETEYVDN